MSWYFNNIILVLKKHIVLIMLTNVKKDNISFFLKC